MAIYKPTYCEPFLSTEDFTTITASNPLYLYCKIASSNFDVTGYRIRLLGPNNEQQFPPASQPETSLRLDSISFIEDLKLLPLNPDPSNPDTNSGRNGTFLKIPFYIGAGSKASNTVSRNQINNDDLTLFNGNDYKWIITLYQLEKVTGGSGDNRYRIPTNVNYYDIILTTGVIVGSTPKRIQTMPSDKILSDYYIQPVQINGVSASGNLVSQRASSWIHSGGITPVGSRGRIYTYDNTLGHLYPQLAVEGAWENVINRTLWLSGSDGVANGIQVFKQSGNWDDLQTTQKVDMMPYGAIPWTWVTTPANLGQSYGQQEYWVDKQQYNSSTFYPFDTASSVSLTGISVPKQSTGVSFIDPEPPVCASESEWWVLEKNNHRIYHSTNGGASWSMETDIQDSGTVLNVVQLFNVPYSKNGTRHSRLWVQIQSSSNSSLSRFMSYDYGTETPTWEMRGDAYLAWECVTPVFSDAGDLQYWFGALSAYSKTEYQGYIGYISGNETSQQSFITHLYNNTNGYFVLPDADDTTRFIMGFGPPPTPSQERGYFYAQTIWSGMQAAETTQECWFVPIRKSGGSAYGPNEWDSVLDPTAFVHFTGTPTAVQAQRAYVMPHENNSTAHTQGIYDGILRTIIFSNAAGTTWWKYNANTGESIALTGLSHWSFVGLNEILYTKNGSSIIYKANEDYVDRPVLSLANATLGNSLYADPVQHTTTPWAAVLVKGTYNLLYISLDGGANWVYENIEGDANNWSALSIKSSTNTPGAVIGYQFAGVMIGQISNQYSGILIASLLSSNTAPIQTGSSIPVSGGQRIVLNYQPINGTFDWTYNVSIAPCVSDSAFNGIFTPDFSSEFYDAQLNVAKSVEDAELIKITVYWRRAVDADMWGELLNKIVMIDPNNAYSLDENGNDWSGQNIQINIDNYSSGGVINITPFKFVAEKPIKLYELDETNNPDTNTTAIIFYNNPTDFNIETIPANTLFVKPLANLENGNIIKFTGTGEWGTINNIDKTVWGVNIWINGVQYQIQYSVDPSKGTNNPNNPSGFNVEDLADANLLFLNPTASEGWAFQRWSCGEQVVEGICLHNGEVCLFYNSLYVPVSGYVITVTATFYQPE